MAVSRTGPLTKDTTTIALGLAQIRVAQSSPYIGQSRAILTASHSVGALASTKFGGNLEFFKLESGYPLLEDAIYPLREAASMEIAFKEMTPANLALARGLDPTLYTNAHLGEIPLGTIAAPVSIRMEAVYTYPDGTNTMTIIFPRAQVSAPIEMDLAQEEPAAITAMIESKRADDGVSGGHIIWNGAPLGKIVWDDGSQTTTTSSSSSTTSTA